MKRLERPASGGRRPVGVGGRGFLKRFLVTILILAFILGGVLIWLGFFSDVCTIKRVEVTGNQNLTTEYIRQISGVYSYKNLLTLPVGRLADNLERDPWIREAWIARGLPSTVKMRVKERSALAVLDCGGTYFVVDETGFVIGAVSADHARALLSVSCADQAPPKITEKVKNKTVSECIAVVASLPSKVRDVLHSADPFDPKGISFATKSGFSIIYGTPGDESKKNEILEAILTDISNNDRQVEYIDISTPDSPVIMPR